MADDPLAQADTVWESSNDSVTVTLKGESGYDAPWIVLKGSTPEDVLRQFEGDGLALLLDKVSAAGASFKRVWMKHRNAPVSEPGQYGKPAGATTKPESNELPFASSTSPDHTTCSHGPRTRHEAGGKVGWVCEIPKGQPGRCDTIFE